MSLQRKVTATLTMDATGDACLWRRIVARINGLLDAFAADARKLGTASATPWADDDPLDEPEPPAEMVRLAAGDVRRRRPPVGCLGGPNCGCRTGELVCDERAYASVPPALRSDYAPWRLSPGRLQGGAL